MMRAHQRQGYALIAVLTALVVVTLATAVMLTYLIGMRTMHKRRARQIAAFHIAEAGLAKARWEIARGNLGYAGEQDMAFGKGKVAIVVSKPSDDAVYDVHSRARAGQAKLPRSVCELRAQIRRAKGGQATLVSWSQVSGTRALPRPPKRAVEER